MKWLSAKGATGAFQEPTASEASVQVSLLETLTARRATPAGACRRSTASSLTTPIAQAVAQGRRVVAYDSPLPGTAAQLYIGTPNTTAGCDAGKAMTQAIGSGEVVAISGSLTAANTQQRMAGFEQCAGSGIKVVQKINDNQDVATARVRPAGHPAGQPSIKGIYARLLLRRRRGRPGGPVGQRRRQGHDRVRRRRAEHHHRRQERRDRRLDPAAALLPGLHGRLRARGGQGARSAAPRWPWSSRTSSAGRQHPEHRGRHHDQGEQSDFANFWSGIGISAQ